MLTTNTKIVNKYQFIMILNELFLIAMGVNTIFFFAGVYITGMHILMHRRKTFDIDAKPGKLYN